jgi:uncharacterized protein (DUF885 family)
MHKSFLSVLLFSLPLLCAAQTSNPQAGDKLSSTFSKLSDQFVKESLVLSPVSASQAGYHQYLDRKTGKTVELDAQLDEVSQQAADDQQKFYTEWRQRFRKETPVASLDAQDAADYRLIDDQISLALLELDKIQSYKHNPTGYVELIGSGLFLPLTQEYASKEVRVGHVVSRIGQIPRFIDQTKSVLLDADPIFISTAIDENEGNINLVESVAGDIPADSPLKAQYDKVAPAAKKSLTDFNAWLKDDLAKRPANGRTWRLGAELYAPKFHYVMETSTEPAQLLADAETELKAVRAEMLQLALPLHKEMFPDGNDYPELQGRARENKIISEVLNKIADDHCQRDHLVECARADVDSIKQFIREKKIVALGTRDNLKVVPTPEYMRGSFSVGGFHSAPPLEPNAEAEYWVTPISPKATPEQAESKLREYNNYALKWLTIHEALPGHYVQFEHANDVQPPTRRLVRALFSNGPYVEGWAEYIAQVMMDEGYLNHDPKFRLVMRKIRLRVISNTILDIKMQIMNMTDEQAMDLMLNDAFQTQAEADGKLQRAKLTSTQLPTYYLGIREWFALRKKYQAAKGNSFSLEEFHNRALDQGPLPVEYLEKIILPEGVAAK